MRRTLITVLILSWMAFGAARYVNAEPLIAIEPGRNSTQRLFVFDSAVPGVITSQRQVTGLLSPSEVIIGFDYRPANGQLYGLGREVFGGGAIRLYTIDTETGAATFVRNLVLRFINTYRVRRHALSIANLVGARTILQDLSS